MSHSETKRPVTELCERAWKLLIRHGEKRTTPQYERYMRYTLRDYELTAHARHLWVKKSTDGELKTLFEVDEEGNLINIDVLECAYALEVFREVSVLDDLAEVSEVEE